MQKTPNKDLGRPDLKKYKSLKKLPVIVVLDNVRSASNVGSVFRTSDSFMVEEIILCGITATPPNKEINKTALGATESVSWSHNASTVSAVESLKQKGYRTYAVEQVAGAIMLNNWKPSDEKVALIFGNEVDGVNQDVINLCDGCIEIPQGGTKHSLNVSVAAGIVIWEAFKSRPPGSKLS